MVVTVNANQQCNLIFVMLMLYTYIPMYHVRVHTYLHIYTYICDIYVSIFSANNVITCARLRLKQVWRLTKANTEMKREH